MTSITPRNSLFLSLFKIIGLGGFVPAFGHLTLTYFFGYRQIFHEPLHALVEGLGSFIAFTILFLIQSGKGLLKNTQIYNVWIVCALLAMTLFDGFHAAMKPGNLFVWFHSIATFSGGLLFALVWVPRSISSRMGGAPKLVGLAGLSLSFFSIIFPTAIPLMIQAGEFTPLTKFLNVSGGSLFAIASVHFMVQFAKRRERNYALLASHCLLFGTSGLLFEFSKIWDPGWWCWHVMRLSAYSILVHFFYETFRDAEKEINELNDQLITANLNLEKKVEQRTELIHEQQKILQASSKMSALGEMAGGIAHEINSPLASIKTISSQMQEIIDDEPLDKSLLKDMSTQVEKTTDRIARIVQGLRTFSRDGSRDPLHPVNVRQLIDETLSLCQERLKHQGTHVGIQDVRPDLFFDGRATEISQVLLNLVNNANDAVASLKEKWVKIAVKDSDDWIEIQVTDSGGGVPTEVREKIFQPFFTTKEIGKGTGMGLSIAVGIMRGHHGDLKLDTQCSNTRFVIRLPKKKALLATQKEPG